MGRACRARCDCLPVMASSPSLAVIIPDQKLCSKREKRRECGLHPPPTPTHHRLRRTRSGGLALFPLQEQRKRELQSFPRRTRPQLHSLHTIPRYFHTFLLALPPSPLSPFLPRSPGAVDMGWGFTGKHAAAPRLRGCKRRRQRLRGGVPTCIKLG